jgi:hypothetical protein
MNKPCIHAYPPETVIAEKYQAMVALGTVNSRMKDFFDLWFMANSMEFEYDLLREAIENTFKQRNTQLPEQMPIALTSEFAAQKQVQWKAFLRKSQINNAPNDLSEVIDRIKVFLDLFSGMKDVTYQRWVPNMGWSR